MENATHTDNSIAEFSTDRAVCTGDGNWLVVRGTRIAVVSRTGGSRDFALPGGFTARGIVAGKECGFVLRGRLNGVPAFQTLTMTAGRPAFGRPIRAMAAEADGRETCRVSGNLIAADSGGYFWGWSEPGRCVLATLDRELSIVAIRTVAAWESGKSAASLHLAQDAISGRIAIAWGLDDERIFVAFGDPEKEAFEICNPVLDGFVPSGIFTAGSYMLTWQSRYGYIQAELIRPGQNVAAAPGRVASPVFGCDPRFFYTIASMPFPAMAADNVPMLFWVDLVRNQLFYSRFTGGWEEIFALDTPLNPETEKMPLYAPIRELAVAPDGDMIFADFGAAGFRGIALPHHTLQIKNETVLRFFDLRMFRRVINLTKTLGSMTKSDCNPLIPRGESGAFNCVRAMNHGSFFDTGNGYAGFFNGSDGNREPFDWWNFFRYGRACSRDGVHWEVAAADLPFSSPTAIQFHPDEPEASRRYKGVHFAIAGERETMARNGQPELCGRSTPGWLYTSADGIHFSVTDATISWPEEYMFLEHCPMNITCDPLDPDGKYYRAYGYASLSLGRRAATVAWSRDLTEWRVEPVIALTTERAAYPYISCGAAAQIHGMIVRKLQGDYIALVHNQENHDHTNITCAYSRDGIHFEPVCPGQKLLDNGAAGAWDCDHMAPLNFHCGVDAWQIYYSGMRLADNSASLGLATIVPDGIVMLRFSDHEAPAELETLDFRIDERCELAVEIDADEVDPRITCIHCHDGTVREGGRLILKPGEYRLRFTFTARDAAAAIRKIRICNHAL